MTDIGTRVEREPSGWATGGVIFAATMMILAGVFEFFQGLAAIIDDQFFVVLPNYAFEVDTTAWGWIHLIIGLLVALAGFYLAGGSKVAGWVAVLLAVLVAIANFFFIPYYPFWSIVIIVLAVYVIWAIVRSEVLD